MNESNEEKVYLTNERDIRRKCMEYFKMRKTNKFFFFCVLSLVLQQNKTINFFLNDTLPIYCDEMKI